MVTGVFPHQLHAIFSLERYQWYSRRDDCRLWPPCGSANTYTSTGAGRQSEQSGTQKATVLGVRYALLTKRKTSGACSQPSTGWSGMSRSLLMTGGSSISAADWDRQREAALLP